MPASNRSVQPLAFFVAGAGIAAGSLFMVAAATDDGSARAAPPQQTVTSTVAQASATQVCPGVRTAADCHVVEAQSLGDSPRRRRIFRDHEAERSKSSLTLSADAVRLRRVQCPGKRDGNRSGRGRMGGTHGEVGQTAPSNEISGLPCQPQSVLAIWPWLALTGAFQLGDDSQASRSVLSRALH